MREWKDLEVGDVFIYRLEKDYYFLAYVLQANEDVSIEIQDIKNISSGILKDAPIEVDYFNIFFNGKYDMNTFKLVKYLGNLKGGRVEEFSVKFPQYFI